MREEFITEVTIFILTVAVAVAIAVIIAIEGDNRIINYICTNDPDPVTCEEALR